MQKLVLLSSSAVVEKLTNTHDAINLSTHDYEYACCSARPVPAPHHPSIHSHTLNPITYQLDFA